MVTRRQLMISAASIAGGLAAGQGCSAGSGGDAAYADAVRKIWRPTDGAAGDRASLMLELVRYATLAASSHNTQCWKFRIAANAISVFPDLQRRCPAVDPDDHHLFASLGCAVENLARAALANGLEAEVRFDAAKDGEVRVDLVPTKAVASPLFEAIPRRQSTRAEFDARPLSGEELRLLERTGTSPGVRVLLLTDSAAMERVLEHVVQANTAQMNDSAFVAELKAWIRFGDEEALRTGDGLFSRCTGNSSVPRWLGSPLFSLFFRKSSENDKYARHIRSSAGIAIFASQSDDKAHWVEAGRSYQRFALQATALGIRTAFLNQPVEVSELRPQFADFLGLGGRRPDLVVRFGRGPEMPRSLRRPVQAVLAA